MANSIAIFTDVTHLAGDLIGFGLSIYALRLSRRQATNEYHFGWKRSEIISTLLSVLFLISITLWLVIEAVDRIRNPSNKVLGKEMLIIAVIGLFFNLVKIKILSQGGGNHQHPFADEGDFE
jgi:cation diffusion facilitator family transporter